MDALLSPLQLGSLTLHNRVVMAPLTRCRADANHVPTPMMATYYAQRASAGLIIAEATMVQEGNSAFWREPGIYSASQVKGWGSITEAVHEAGGKIFLQIWHGGRACHSALNNGVTPVSASALPIRNDEVHTPQGKKPYETPRALETREIAEIVEAFKRAAQNAKLAGFDGVEIHAANGYLIDQFLRDGTNQRGDQYGGSKENRSRFLKEILTAVVDIWDRSAVGVRVSPLNSFNDMKDSDPVGLMAYLATMLDEFGIGYLHVMRGDFFGAQSGDVLSVAREHFKGVLMSNMGYTPAEAVKAVETRLVDAVAFGHHFISNPDLVECVRRGTPLAEPDASTFYTQDERGYTDYPNRN